MKEKKKKAKKKNNKQKEKTIFLGFFIPSKNIVIDIRKK